MTRPTGVTPASASNPAGCRGCVRRPGGSGCSVATDSASNVRVSASGLGFDPERELVLLELRERAADEGDEGEGEGEEGEGESDAVVAEVEPDDPGYVARIYATRAQVRAMAARGAEAVTGGRPLCPLCEFPMDPAGHQCPRWN